MTSPSQKSAADTSRVVSHAPALGWLITLLSITWILLWVAGCILLMFADPRPRFVSVWLIMAPMISMMTGQLGLAKEISKSGALWQFVRGLLMTCFFVAITLLGEETLRENVHVWAPGLGVAALGYAAAIASFIIRWKRLPNKSESFAG